MQKPQVINEINREQLKNLFIKLKNIFFIFVIYVEIIMKKCLTVENLAHIYNSETSEDEANHSYIVRRG